MRRLLPSKLTSWIIVVVCLAMLIALRVMRPGEDSEANFPSRPISIICPYSAGGGTDLFARALARSTEKSLGNTVIVNNITGGGGAVGLSAGLLAPADGYAVTAITFELVSLPLQGLAPFKHSDFDLLLRVNMDPAVLAVNMDCPANTLEEFIEWARTRGRVSIGNSGPGSVWHLASAMMAEALNIPATFVPFGGASPAVTALAGGHVDAVVVSPGELKTQTEAGLIKSLAIMSEERLEIVPKVPTFRELGHDLFFGTWRGLAVPKGVPEGIKMRLQEGFREAMQNPEFIEMAARGSLNLSYADASTFRAEVEIQHQEVDALMERLGLK